MDAERLEPDEDYRQYVSGLYDEIDLLKATNRSLAKALVAAEREAKLNFERWQIVWGRHAAERARRQGLAALVPKLWEEWLPLFQNGYVEDHFVAWLPKRLDELALEEMKKS